MIEAPDRYIGDFVTEETEYITVHQEACPHLHRTIQHIKSFGVKAGVSINPGTPPGVLDYIIEDIDLVLVMSVNPGFGGQEFITSSLEKIRYLTEIKKSAGLKFEIEVDGGVNAGNISKIALAGADIIVAGSNVFAGGRIFDNVKALLAK